MVGPRVDTTSAAVAHCKSLEGLGDATLPGGSDFAIVLQHAKLEALRFNLEAKDAKASAAQLSSELELSRQQAEDELSATVAKMQAEIRDSVAQRADMQRRWNAILATERLGKDEVSQLEEKSRQAMEERDAAAALVEEEIRQRMEAEEAREEALNEVAALREALQTAEEAMRGVEKQLSDETRLRYVAEAAANAAQADAARATERSQEEKARAQVAVDAVVATDEEIRVAREQAEAIATEAAKTVLRAAEARVTAAKDEAASMLRAAKEECTGKIASAARRLATLEAELANTKQAAECEVRAARQQLAAAEAGRKEAEAQAEASAAAAKEASLRQLLEQRAHMLELQMLRQAAHEEMATAELVAKAALSRGEGVVSQGEGRAADVAHETAPPPHSPGASSLAYHSPTHPRFAQKTPSPHGPLARRAVEDEPQLALPARRTAEEREAPLAPHTRTTAAEEQPPLAPLEGRTEEEEKAPLASPAGRAAEEGEAPLAAPGRQTTHVEAAPCKAGEAATQRRRAEAKIKLEHLLARAGAEAHASPVRTAISHFSLSSLGPPAESIAPHGSHRGAGATWCPSPSASGSAASNSENGDDGSHGGLDENKAAAAVNLLPLLHYPINKPAGKGAGLALSNSRRAAAGEREGSQVPVKAASAQPRGPAACSDRAIRGSEGEAGGTQTHDDRLWHAFMAADTDGSGAISKRELYRALDAVGLYASPSEQLAIWKMFDRNSKGKVEWGEFSTIGRALLRTSSAAALSGAQPRRSGVADPIARSEAEQSEAHGFARSAGLQALTEGCILSFLCAAPIHNRKRPLQNDVV
ncbi:hypothetical protein AB1Y20_016339 [Prymnesium parvum]|uniref:EF-hand domain-containing protein n=1 Tax=Prymnesium parvum TaxID=97485 RepID=A0AB34IFN1_PRYPA